jgi:hypothetical protein
LKLKCDEPLSNVAFKFNMRRYNKGAGARGGAGQMLIATSQDAIELYKRGFNMRFGDLASNVPAAWQILLATS